MSELPRMASDIDSAVAKDFAKLLQAAKHLGLSWFLLMREPTVSLRCPAQLRGLSRVFGRKTEQLRDFAFAFGLRQTVPNAS